MIQPRPSLAGSTRSLKQRLKLWLRRQTSPESGPTESKNSPEQEDRSRLGRLRGLRTSAASSTSRRRRRRARACTVATTDHTRTVCVEPCSCHGCREINVVPVKDLKEGRGDTSSSHVEFKVIYSRVSPGP